MPFWSKKKKYPANYASTLNNLVEKNNYAELKRSLETEGVGYLENLAFDTRIGTSLLETAAENGCLDIMQLLIYHGIQAEFLKKDGNYYSHKRSKTIGDRKLIAPFNIKNDQCLQLLIKAADNHSSHVRKRLGLLFGISLLLGIGLTVAIVALGIYFMPLLTTYFLVETCNAIVDSAAILGFGLGFFGGLLGGMYYFPPKIDVEAVLGKDFTPSENAPNSLTNSPVSASDATKDAALSLSTKGVLEPASGATKDDDAQPLFANGQRQQQMLQP